MPGKLGASRLMLVLVVGVGVACKELDRETQWRRQGFRVWQPAAASYCCPKMRSAVCSNDWCGFQPRLLRLLPFLQGSKWQMGDGHTWHSSFQVCKRSWQRLPQQKLSRLRLLPQGCVAIGCCSVPLCVSVCVRVCVVLGCSGTQSEQLLNFRDHQERTDVHRGNIIIICGDVL